MVTQTSYCVQLGYHSWFHYAHYYTQSAKPKPTLALTQYHYGYLDIYSI